MSRCRVSSLSTPQTLTSDLRPQSQANYIPSSRVSRRVHSDETPRSSLRTSSSVHPVAEMRKAQQPQNSQVPLDEHRDRLQEQRGSARGDQVGHKTMTGNHVVQQGEVALMGDKKRTAHGFHHFTEDDIGPNSVALLKDGDTNFSRTESTNISRRNSKSPPVKKQLQQHGNITARRRSDGKKDQSLTQEMPLKVHARRTELPSNGSPPVLPSNKTTSQGTTMLRYALVQQDTHHSTKSWVNTHSEPPPQGGIMLPTDANLSFESEYAELPQSLYESRVPSSLPNHPFLEESFSKNVPLPRRLVELQHGLSQFHPVRDSSRQDVYHVQASTGGQLRQGSTITASKVVTKDITAVNEDSGINSPFYVQP